MESKEEGGSGQHPNIGLKRPKENFGLLTANKKPGTALAEYEHVRNCEVLGQKAIPYFGIYGRLLSARIIYNFTF